MMSGDTSTVGGATVPDTGSGGMDPTSASGEGATPVGTPPSIPVSHETGQKSSGNGLGRPKNSAIHARMDGIEAKLDRLLASNRSPASEKPSLAREPASLSTQGSDPSGSTGRGETQNAEVFSDEETEDAATTSTTGAAPRASSDTGASGLSDAVDDAADQLTEIAAVVTKPFRGLRLGSWNYGRRPK